ncbi:unnamed protein product [Schistosoma margrebowiei]|uniref:Uncharacterized protein n=1 Tax=Schistosoma margrebowiei TaxID=48269 RepID=A0A183LNB7_9TREM|nr:unnamed protein product [Schistosoma margrebowiei]
MDPGAYVHHLFGIKDFLTPLGGFSISTNLVKAPDIRSLSCQFYKLDPRHEKDTGASPFAALVWNQGFPTLLGGLSVTTNPVKALDIRFSSSRFHKQHP